MMSFVAALLIRSLIPQILLIAVCITGDNLILAAPNRLTRALYDSLTHGSVGFLSWIIVCGVSLDRPKLLSCILCAFLACVVDVDHFIAAHSFKLQDAVHLPSRPFLHNTLLMLILVISIWIIVKALNICWNITTFDDLPWMCLVAWTTHHVRDAHRRGLWNGTLGNTPPLPQWLYITVILAVTWAVTFIFQRVAKTTDGVIYLNGPYSHDRGEHVILEV